MITINCKTCTKEFNISPSRLGKRINCSRHCLALNQRRGQNKDCGYCGTIFYAQAADNSKFCSEYCQHKGQIIHNRGVVGYKNNGSYQNGHQALKGVENPNWKGGITPINKIKRNRLRNHNRTWAKAIKQRDGQCLSCGIKRNLEADHIKPIKFYPELQLDLKNGQTLCTPCHQRKSTQDRRIYAY